MDSTTRFLLGGALGAALGYLLSQKNLQKAALQAAQGTTAPTADSPTPALRVKPAPVVTPPAPVIEAEPAPTAEAPFAMAVAAPVMEVPVFRAPVFEEPVDEVPVLEAEVVEASYTPVKEPVSIPGPFGEWDSTPPWAFSPQPSPVMDSPAAAAVGAVPAGAPTLEPLLDELVATAIGTPLVEPVVAEPGAAVTELPEASVVEEAPIMELPLVEEPLGSDLELGPTPGLLAEAPAVEVWSAETPWAEPPLIEAPPVPVAEVPIVEPVAADLTIVAPESAEEPPQAEWPAEPYVPASEQPESELFLTRDFLDEPLSGAGWQPTAVPVLEEALEDLLPNVPDEFPPLAAAEIERPTLESREGRSGAVWSETVVEMPVVEAPVAEAAAVAPTVEFDAGASGVAQVEEAFFESSVVEEPYMEAVIEAPLAEASVVEVPLVEEVVAESSQTQAAPVDDLKARIEETRRRIRHELEQPFVTSPEPEPPEDDWTISPAVAADEEADMGTDLSGMDDAAAPLAALVVEPELTVEEPVDYEAMRSRIEVTRSRLKAKAFDAMMTGESALLGRDTEDQKDKRRIAPAVDTEVEETIETSLREEEE